jgi:adenosine deaminase CECR1
LHNHFGLANWAEQWYDAATDPNRTHGNEYFTRVEIRNCPDSTEPVLLFYNIQRSTYLKLSDCRKAEYQSLGSLSPERKREWLSAHMLDRPGEGRNEFFEGIVPRMGDLLHDPWLAADLLVENMKRYSAQGLRYLETQTGLNYQDREGHRLPPAEVAALFRGALNRPEAKATGMTVRFLLTIIRFAPNAEEALERAYAFVDAHRDLWVGINMAGREDNDKGYALRFLETYRKMRRTYSGIQLSIHAGEVDSPGHQVRNTLLLGATRIGHGVNLITDPDTMLLMQNKRYLVEVNLISNRLLEYTPDLSKHPFPEYLRTGIPVCLNTDDAGSWDSNITDEYFTAVTNFHLTWREIVQMGRDSLQYSFVEEPVKAKLLAEYARDVAKFEREYGGEDWARKLARVKPVYSGYATRNFGIR